MKNKFWRRISQLFFVSFIAVAGIRHQIVGGGPKGAPPIDSYCVFGGVETLYSWIHNGEFLMKTNASNLILLFAILMVTILAGAVFCGWICPLGAIQEWLNIIGQRFFNRRLKIPKGLDIALRSLKYILLSSILIITIQTGRLWFEGYDPFKVFFHFKFDTAAYIILITFSILAILIERFWCKYLCPLGAIIFPLSYFGLINLNQSKENCNDCGLCNHACSMDLQPSQSLPNKSITNAECIKCLDCMESCNQPDGLYLTLGKENR